jgi:hypothetical protein
MTQKTELTGALVTGNFTFNATLPNGKTLAISGYVYEGESLESVNARVTAFDDIVNHQRDRNEVEVLEAKLAAAIDQLEVNHIHYGAMLKKRDAGGKLTAAEKSALEVMDINVKRHNDEIQKGQDAITALKEKIGKA